MKIEELLKLSLEELSNRYYIYNTGKENIKEINYNISRLSNHIQEIIKVNIEIDNRIENINLELKNIQDQIKFNEQKYFRDLSRSNKMTTKENKLTDKAITSEAFVDARNENILKKEIELNTELVKLKNLSNIWENLKKQIYFLKQNFETTSMNNASALKNFAGLKTDIIIPNEEKEENEFGNPREDELF